MAGVIASLIIKGVITFALLTGAFLTGKEATKIIAPKLNPQPSPSPVLSETFGPSPSPTLAPKKTVKQPTPTVNSDPIVTCQFKYIPVRQMKLSECKKSTECQLVQGGEWFISPSVEECRKAQEKYWQDYYKDKAPSLPKYDYPPVPALKPWPTSKPLPTFTPLPTFEPYIPPAPSEEELQIIIDQLEEDIKQCKREVHSYYNQQVRSCGRFGGTSARPACEEIMNRERENALKKCEY